MKNTRKHLILFLLLSALCLALAACAGSSSGTSKTPVTFNDDAFRAFTARAFGVSEDALDQETLDTVEGLDLYYYAEQPEGSEEYIDVWSVTLYKKGYHTVAGKYYAASAQEREELEKPSDYLYYEKLEDFSGYADLANFRTMRDFSIFSEYRLMNMNLLPYLTRLQGLEKLHIYNYITPDLSQITQLVNLRELSIGMGTRQADGLEAKDYISDITPLKSLKKLRDLSLEGTLISDLSPLSSLPELTSLSCTNAALSDISSVEALKNLENVNFYFNAISDVTPLTKLPKLKTIYLDYNYISDISPFASLDADTVEYVSLDMNSIEDYEPLRHLGSSKVYVGFDLNWDEDNAVG